MEHVSKNKNSLKRTPTMITPSWFREVDFFKIMRRSNCVLVHIGVLGPPVLFSMYKSALPNNFLLEKKNGTFRVD
jgi:hypothetical protein